MTDSSRFDQAAAQWDNSPALQALARAVGDAIRRAVPLEPPWRALDYGAGTGLVTLQILPRIAAVTAVDASAGMLDQLSKKLAASGINNVFVRQWDILSAPFPETGFDLCFSSMTLHHLRDVPLAFERFRQLLKPGGWLAMADLDTEDGSFHGPNNDVFHNGFERAAILEWLGKAGFVGAAISDAHRLLRPDASGAMRSYGIFLAAAQAPR